MRGKGYFRTKTTRLERKFYGRGIEPAGVKKRGATIDKMPQSWLQFSFEEAFAIYLYGHWLSEIQQFLTEI